MKWEARTLDAGANVFFLLVLPWLCFPVKQERNVQRKKIFKRGRGRQWTQTWKENIIEKEKLAQSLFPTEGFHKQSSRPPLASLVFLTCFWPCRALICKTGVCKGLRGAPNLHVWSLEMPDFQGIHSNRAFNWAPLLYVNFWVQPRAGVRVFFHIYVLMTVSPTTASCTMGLVYDWFLNRTCRVKI